MSINAHKMPPINQIPHAVADVAADPPVVWSVDKYYPSPPDGGTVIRRKHLAITRAFQIARLGRRVRLISSRFRAHFHYPRRRPPALNGENSHNADVPNNTTTIQQQYNNIINLQQQHQSSTTSSTSIINNIINNIININHQQHHQHNNRARTQDEDE